MQHINCRIQQRHDTLANWASNDIVLLSGELAVVDCGSQTKFKVGNGISSFNQLPFTDQNVLCTIWVDAHAISQGTQAHSTPFGLAAGWRLSANANYSQALGFKSQTSASHDFSFAWNGNDKDYTVLGEDYYTSHGKGTFNINPLNGLNGFYVGEDTLSGVISASCKEAKEYSDAQLTSELQKYQLSGEYLSSNALDDYRTYAQTVSSLSANGYATNKSLATTLGSISKELVAQVDSPQATINSIHKTLLQLLNILSGGTAA